MRSRLLEMEGLSPWDIFEEGEPGSPGVGGLWSGGGPQVFVYVRGTVLQTTGGLWGSGRRARGRPRGSSTWNGLLVRLATNTYPQASDKGAEP